MEIPQKDVTMLNQSHHFLKKKKEEKEKGEKCKHITEHPHEVNYLSYANKHMQIRSNSYMF